MNTVQVNVNYRNDNDNVDTSFSLNAILLQNIEVTTVPNKTVYHYGEIIDYTGMTVTAAYDDHSTQDITGLCMISPKSGSSFDGTSDIQIEYSEGQDKQTCNLTLTALELKQLVIVSPPDKTSYKLGEAIDYSGIMVKAVYSDDSEIDVTASCIFSPVAGKAFNPDTDTSSLITYLAGENEFSEKLTFTSVTMALQVEENPIKTAYKYGEAIDYSGIVVKAVFSDGRFRYPKVSRSRDNGSKPPEDDFCAEILGLHDKEHSTDVRALK